MSGDEIALFSALLPEMTPVQTPPEKRAKAGRMQGGTLLLI